MGFIKYRSGPDAEWQEIQGIKGDKGDTPVKGVDYYTEAEKNELIQEIQNSVVDGEVNLANYYTKTETDAAIAAALAPDLSDYYTKTEADAAIEAAKQDLSGYALKTDIPSTTGLAAETYVDEKIAAIPAPDLSNYYNKTQVNELVKTAKPDLTDYATKDDVATAIEGIEVGDVDLTDYYTKEETDAALGGYLPTTGGTVERLKVNGVLDALGLVRAEDIVISGEGGIGGFIRSIPNELVAIRYTTPGPNDPTLLELPIECSQPESLANKKYVDEAIETAIAAIEPEEVDLSNYYTKSEISTTLGNYYTKTQTNNAIKAVFTYNSSTGRLDIKV